MRKLRIQPARVDMLEAWHWVARDSIESANRILEKFESEIRRSREMPGIGHSRSDVRKKEYRFWKVFEYLIVYRFNDSELSIVRVVHGRQNLRRLFRR